MEQAREAENGQARRTGRRGRRRRADRSRRGARRWADGGMREGGGGMGETAHRIQFGVPFQFPLPSSPIPHPPDTADRSRGGGGGGKCDGRCRKNPCTRWTPSSFTALNSSAR